MMIDKKIFTLNEVKQITGFCFLLCVLVGSPVTMFAARTGDVISIGNDRVQRKLAFDGNVWRTVAFVRLTPNDALAVDSDEFHLFYFNNTAATIDQFEVAGEPAFTESDGVRTLSIRYSPKADALKAIPELPEVVVIRYSIQPDHYFIRKQIELVVGQANEKALDRLEVERFSTSVKATRGGRGQPVFLDNKWFTGIEHPSARTRHTNGNTPIDDIEYSKEAWGKHLAWLYVHRVQGRDIDTSPREGLVRLFHFPAYPKRAEDGKLHLLSKPAVTGTSKPGDPLELGFMDYFETIRLEPRSFSHYNNWYDASGKDLSIDNFVDKTLATYNSYFSRYGVNVQAMVPDNFNWHISSSFYGPNPKYFPEGDKDMRKLNDALKENGSCLGLWLTLSGNNGMNPTWAKENGYQWGPGGHFLLANLKNKAAMKKRLKELISDVGVNYFKHDFNTLKSTAENGHAPTERHGHEAEVDAMFELLDWEVECNPDIFINITSGTWFSPWLLAKCRSIWMLSHDDGAGESGPEPSNFLHQQSYRDEVIYPAWGKRETSPLIPVSQLMTHGIICGPHSVKRNYNNIKEDSLTGWASGVMLYYMRGTLLQEWYITPEDLSRGQWDALGRTSRWFKENESILKNTVFWGGDPADGEPFGYAAWNGDRGIISMRNSLPVPKKVSIPFDKTVWYRGKEGVKYKADVVFPWHGQFPEGFISGKPIEVTIPPYTLMVMHLALGKATDPSVATLDAIAVKAEIKKVDDCLQELSFAVPSQKMANCQLMVTAYGSRYPDVWINGKKQKHVRKSWSTSWDGMTDKWRPYCFDLLPYQGKQICVKINVEPLFTDTFCDVRMIQDLSVDESSGSDDVRLPLPVSQGARRAVETLCENVLLSKAKPVVNHILFGQWRYKSADQWCSRAMTADKTCHVKTIDISK